LPKAGNLNFIDNSIHQMLLTNYRIRNIADNVDIRSHRNSIELKVFDINWQSLIYVIEYLIGRYFSIVIHI